MNITMSLNKLKTNISEIIEIPEIDDEGKLSFAEAKRSLPFAMKRFYLIYDVKNQAIRGKHAHKKTDQVLFCLRGSITIVLDNGVNREEVVLSKPNKGILLPRMLWHEMKDFTRETMLLVAASEYFDEKDYIRDYETFVSLTHKKWLNFNLSSFKLASAKSKLVKLPL